LERADVPPWHSVDTMFGSMKLREFGPHDGPLVICIHGMRDNDFIRDEWNQVASKLATDGLHVVVPDFHSGPDRLRPGVMSGDDVRALVGDLALHLDGFVPARYRAVMAPKVAVLGKSWGSRMAAEAGASEQVVAVGLVVPPISEEDAGKLLPAIRGEVALAMVGDDDVAPIDRGAVYRKLLGDRATWIEADAGGHRIVPKFVDPLASFLQRVRERFSHGDDEAAPEL